MSIEIIKNPWQELLLECVSSANDRISISCPFIKSSVTKKLLSAKKNDTELFVISRFKLENFHQRVSDLDALESILQHSGNLKYHQSLHAKTYIFDDKKVVITSANLTTNGLLNNYEYGVLLTDSSSVNVVADDFEKLFDDEKSGSIDLDQIGTYREILNKIPKEKRVKFPKIDLEQTSDFFDVYTGGTESIKEILSGWKLSIFECLLQVQDDNFSLSDIYKFEDTLQQQYPENKYIRDKIRQQLQELRDLGLIEFFGQGQYRKLWRED